MKVTLYHNEARGAMLDGYRPGDPLVRVFDAEVPDEWGRHPRSVADQMFLIGNIDAGDTDNPVNAYLVRAYRQERNRSLSVGDVVVVGEAPFAVDKVGFSLVTGTLGVVRVASTWRGCDVRGMGREGEHHG